MHRSRIGIGYDIHRLEAYSPDGRGRPFSLATVPIESELGMVAEGDPDILLHATADALLGAFGGETRGHWVAQMQNDIDFRSTDVVEVVSEEIRRAGWRISNLDAVILLERPKLRELLPAVRKSLASQLGLANSDVSIKVKTNEGFDAIGRGEAISVTCVVIIEK